MDKEELKVFQALPDFQINLASESAEAHERQGAGTSSQGSFCSISPKGILLWTGTYKLGEFILHP